VKPFLFINTVENPWNNVYGLARSVLALGTLLTLLFNKSDVIFFDPNEAGQIVLINAAKVYTWNFFTIWNNLVVARVFAIILLAIVISGWRPRLTGILHTWISLSFIHLGTFVDGGDQITAVLSLLLLPICLSDNRIWHWTKGTNGLKGKSHIYLQLFCLSLFLIIRVQMAVVYLNAATAKLSVHEWLDGTASWYWFKDPVFGYNDSVARVMDPLMKNPIILSFFTWLPIFFEFSMFLGLVLDKKYRKYLLVMGLLFHFSIIIIHGLVSFFFAMAGGLILYLRPFNQEFDFVRLKRFMQNLFRLKSSDKHLSKNEGSISILN